MMLKKILRIYGLPKKGKSLKGRYFVGYEGICDKFTGPCHVTGVFRGASVGRCKLFTKQRLSSFVPVALLRRNKPDSY